MGNAEYTEQAGIALDFIKRVLAKKKVDPETFFFSVHYFFLLFDEEHSFLDRFRYQGMLKAFNIVPVLQENNGKYEIFDNLTREWIVEINGQPPNKYI